MPNPTYPTLAIDSRESRRTSRDGREEDVLGDGYVRVRKLYGDRFDFDVKHPYLTLTEMSTLQAFYAANANAAAIDFTWPEDGLVYVVRLGRSALRTQWVSATRRHAWVRLVAAA